MELDGVVLFSADWCGPCQRLKPLVKDDVNLIITLDDGHTYDVHSIPTVRLYDHGAVVTEIVGPTVQQVKDLRLTYETP